MIYLDDRTWMTSTAAQAVHVAQCWKQALQKRGLEENADKAEFSAVGGKRACKAMTRTLQQAGVQGTVMARPKVLGSRVNLTRKHAAAEAEEKARLAKAELLASWAKCLPHDDRQKMRFYKSTALATAAAPSYSRLPTKKEVRVLDSAQAALTGDRQNPLRRGPLVRLLTGHAGNVTFRIGAGVTAEVVLEAGRGRLTPGSWTAQAKGPVAVSRQWLARQGWKELDRPWSWRHPAAALTLTCGQQQQREEHFQRQRQQQQQQQEQRGARPDPPSGRAQPQPQQQELPQQSQQQPQRTPDGDTAAAVGPHTKKTELQHHLREAWRAEQWRRLQATDSKAAQELRTVDWATISKTAHKVQAWWAKPHPRYRHMQAITSGHWVSQARWATTALKLPAPPCFACGNANADRRHEWTCAALLGRAPKQPTTLWQASLGWPDLRATEEEALSFVADLAEIRHRILDKRYPTRVGAEQPQQQQQQQQQLQQHAGGGHGAHNTQRPE